MNRTETPNELPSNWCWARLDEIASINPGLGNAIPANDVRVSFVPMACVEALTGKLNGLEARPLGEIKRGFTRFRDSDVVFANIAPSMENGRLLLRIIS